MSSWLSNFPYVSRQKTVTLHKFHGHPHANYIVESVEYNRFCLSLPLFLAAFHSEIRVISTNQPCGRTGETDADSCGIESIIK